MAIERLDEIDHEPVVGKFYLVPCVYGADGNRQWKWWPVLLPLHSDPELGSGPALPHWHRDRRFTSKAMRSSAAGGQTGEEREAILFLPKGKDFPREPEWKRRRCIRKMPEWPFNKGFSRLVESLCADKTFDLACMKCPHRGTDLRNLPLRPDGTVMCPAHGLVWSLTTGELVPRTEASRVAA